MERQPSLGRSALAGAALLLLAAWPAAAQPPSPPFVIQLDDAPPARPSPLSRPLESPPPVIPPAPPPEPFFTTPFDPPTGFAGPSGVLPSEEQVNSHFVPVEDRWRIGFPAWDRYGKGHPVTDDYPYAPGSPRDPFNLNVLKGDYPILGQHTFLDVTATSLTIAQPRTLPTPTTPFESTARPFESEFFGRPNQLTFAQYAVLSFDLFHGDAAFKPVDWRVKLTPVANANYLIADELAIVNPDVRRGRDRLRSFVALEEWFVEAKLADLSPDYDFASVRLGSQPFVSDFRGFIFADTNRAVRFFGTRLSNRDQFNLAAFFQQEKDTNSFLNSFNDRHQTVAIANYYRQDFVFPGYTAQVNVVYDHDDPTFKFDKNSFLVRPDPVGVFQPHKVDAVYLGWTGDGHIGRYNISHAFYWALGHDTLNPLANKAQDINAQFAAVELSYDRDWARFRASFLFASGDKDPNNGHACGFDSVLDNPNFAGGNFTFWQRNAIGLFGVNLVQRESLLPDLRSSKIQGQANFVNPGLLLANLGVDFDVTPKLRWVNNVNGLWFDETATLETFTFQNPVHHFIGVDVSTGVEYRPLLSNNIIVVAGLAALIPGRGFRDLYNNLDSAVGTLFSGFCELTLTY